MKLRDIVALLRIRLDKNEASKVDKEVQTSFGKMEAAAKKVGAAIAAAFAVRRIIAFGRDLVKSAAEAEVPWNRLANTLANVGVKFSDVEKSLRLAGRAMQDTTIHDGEDFADTLDRLVSLTGHFNQSLKNVPLVADVAAKFFNGELAPAADLVGQAMNGITRGLRQVGIVTKDATAGLKELASISQGAAENELNTMQGKLSQIRNEWFDIKEEAGAALVRMVTGSADAVVGLEKIRSALNSIGNLFTKKGQLESRLAAKKGQRAFLFDIGGKDPLTAPLVRALTEQIQAIEDELAGIAVSENIASHQPTTAGGPPRAVVETPEQAAARKKREAQEQRRRFREASQSGLAGDDAQTLEGFAAGKGADATQRMNEALGETVDILENDATPALDRWEDQWADIQAVATGAAFEISDAFGEMFELILTQSESVGEALVGFGRNVAAALIGGIADYANVEMAKEIALGIGKLAAGTWPPNPVAWKAAGLHFLSAGKWGIAAGLAGATAGAVGGGGGGRMSGGAADASSNRFDSQRTKEVFYVYVEPFSGKNPVVVRKVGEVLQEVARTDSSIDVRRWDGR